MPEPELQTMKIKAPSPETSNLVVDLVPDLRALLRRTLESLEFDQDEFERQLMIKVEHRLIKLLVGLGVAPAQMLSDYERHHGMSLRRDSVVAERALGTIQRPQQPPQQQQDGYDVG